MPEQAVRGDVASNLWISKLKQEEDNPKMAIELPILLHSIQLILYGHGLKFSLKEQINY